MAGLIKQGSGIYSVQFYDSKRTPKSKRISMGTRDTREAHAMLADLEAMEAAGMDPWEDDLMGALRARQAGEVPTPEPTPERETVTLSEAAQRFIEAKKAAGRSARTVETYRGNLRRWMDAEEIAGKGCRSLTAADVEGYCYAAGIAASTRAKRYRHIRAFVNWTRKRDLLEKDVLRKIESPKEGSKLPRAVSTDELARLLTTVQIEYNEKLKAGHCREGEIIWMKDLFAFSFYSGFRISELERMRWKHVDLEEGTVLLPTQKSGREEVVSIGNRALEVLRRIAPEAIAEHNLRDGLMQEVGVDADPTGEFAMAAQDANETYVFSAPRSSDTDRRSAYWKQSASRAFARFRDAAGIRDKLTLHSLRAGFCTALAKAGASAVEIKNAARHSAIATSMRYVEAFGAKETKGVIDAAFSRGRKRTS